MSRYRKTAIVRLVLPSGDSSQSRPLTTERAYLVSVTIDGKNSSAGYFRSPINDDQWRDFWNRLRSCNSRSSANEDAAFHDAMSIQDLGISLYSALCGLSKELRAFLSPESEGNAVARRLVIQTQRTELQLLPWGAMCDEDGKLFAMHGLSIVQTWDDFSEMQTVTKSRLTLTRVEGTGTSGATADSVTNMLQQSGVIDIVTDRPGDLSADVQGDASSSPGPDILHVEAHGDDIGHVIGGVSSIRFAQQYGKPRIALLWSCFSGAANSWGDSPALWLHRDGATMVLSFQAELHVLDAASISKELFSEVFGPAATRDPETALVHARCAKFTDEFQNACWASMMVYLGSPLDLSALPLNGPRVPGSGWSTPQAANPVSASEEAAQPVAFNPSASMYATPQFSSQIAGVTSNAEGTGGDTAPAEEATENVRQTPGGADIPQDGASGVKDAVLDNDPWQAVEHQVCTMQPGSWKQIVQPSALSEATATLPVEAFAGWRGNVIRLDGGYDPVTPEILQELDFNKAVPPNLNAAEKLVWFFKRVAAMGSSLIVWTNSQGRHMDFLRVIAPGPSLTFLLLTGPDAADTLPGLVDQNRLEAASALCESLLIEAKRGEATDEDLSAAYYACVRVSQPELARQCLQQVASFQEWLLLTGNFMSRGARNIGDGADLLALGERFLGGQDAEMVKAEFALLRKPEDFYRLAMNQPSGLSSPRETARAKHETGYLLQEQGQSGTSEMFYRLALTDLESCGGELRDSRWYFAMSAVLRDLADLLSEHKDRLKESTRLLHRAMAIQAYRGMRLQLGYSETTAARIALTDSRHKAAIDHALRAANRMEACDNWIGWSKALGILFDALAETRQTERMISLANLAKEKVRAATPDEDVIAKLERTFKFEKARAHWIAGELTEARDELEELQKRSSDNDKGAMDREIDRLVTFLRVSRKAAEEAVETGRPVSAAKRIRKGKGERIERG